MRFRLAICFAILSVSACGARAVPAENGRRILNNKEEETKTEKPKMLSAAEKELARKTELVSLFHGLLKAGDVELAGEYLGELSGLGADSGLIELFVERAVSLKKCAVAARFLSKHTTEENKKFTERVLADKVCAGYSYADISWWVYGGGWRWYFDTAIRHQKFRMAAKVLAQADPIDFDVFAWQLYIAALDGLDFEFVMAFVTYGVDGRFLPFKGCPTPTVCWPRALKNILDRNEEWFVARYARDNRLWGPWPEKGWASDTWIEAAFDHAIKRGAYGIAADIAALSGPKKPAKVEKVFMRACREKKLQEAEEIALSHGLSPRAKRCLALLRFEKMFDKRKNKVKIKDDGDWKVRRRP